MYRKVLLYVLIRDLLHVSRVIVFTGGAGPSASSPVCDIRGSPEQVLGDMLPCTTTRHMAMHGTLTPIHCQCLIPRGVCNLVPPTRYQPPAL